MQKLKSLLLLSLTIAPIMAAQQQTPPSLDNSTPTANKDKPQSLHPGMTPPRLLFQAPAKYTDEARSARFEGICVVQLIVDANGKPQNIKIVRSVGMGLDENAVEAVRQYRFTPAMKADGTPVPVLIHVEVNFKLYETHRGH